MSDEINADAFIGNGLTFDDDMLREAEEPPSPAEPHDLPHDAFGTSLNGWGPPRDAQIVVGPQLDPEPPKPEPRTTVAAGTKLPMAMIWTSAHAGNPHIVTVGIWHCTCEAFVLGGRECWAVKATKELIGA